MGNNALDAIFAIRLLFTGNATASGHKEFVLLTVVWPGGTPGAGAYTRTDVFLCPTTVDSDEGFAMRTALQTTLSLGVCSDC